MKKIHCAAVLSWMLVLAGCGGSSTQAFQDKYSGSWASNCYADVNNAVYFYAETITFTSVNAGTVSYLGTVKTFTTPNCSGAQVDARDYAGQLMLVSKKLVGGSTVDEVLVTPEAQSGIKNILDVQADTLLTGANGAPVDGDGYPAQLGNLYRFVRVKS